MIGNINNKSNLIKRDIIVSAINRKDSSSEIITPLAKCKLSSNSSLDLDTGSYFINLKKKPKKIN